VIWSVSEEEQKRYHGATCDRTANADTLARAAAIVGRPIPAWVTRSRHGTTLWHSGGDVIEGRYPGVKVVFRPDGTIPDESTC
jgi:hypothetical protein